ncbi:beta-N-acetylglucosaminidase domain-containing protein [Deinococcus yavapaiensis]|uniref:Hyaluronoglucosaminidase n=1 Tax=Deinococcus yavapaiensis KR-236 TaxID=694435 RepID=A0A318S758_9DEIO|nr:beta-N-acetylglucosaminidase domain-containing protein [Deinococcus yavapaiensis]PYE54594.1 hyaluronoglucosaminidase [Deinococcus yavapaiensis KR-236]
MSKPFGVIEAFYGPPWSWAARHATLDFMGDVGLTAYLYAPKNDPLHRNRWKEPYTSFEWREFERLAEHAARVGVDFIFGLSAIGYQYTNAEHGAIVRGRLERAKACGISSFCLLLDDLPEAFDSPQDAERFGHPARAQALFLNELLPRVPGTLYFCPTEYHGVGRSEYLTILGETLDPRVKVFWTGAKVFADSLSPADVEAVNASLRRQVTIWDNFPVNDLDMRNHLHVEALKDRSPELLSAIDGYFAAPGRLAAAHRVSLRTVAAYLKSPETYEPRAALREAAKASAANEREADALLFLADVARRNPLYYPTALHHSLWPAIDAFWAARGDLAVPDLPGRPPRTSVAANERSLRDLARDMELHVYTLERLRDLDLRNDIAPWVSKLAGWARVLKYALGALDHPHDARAREYVMEEIPLVRDNFHWVAGDTFDWFARACVFEAERLAAGPRSPDSLETA